MGPGKRDDGERRPVASVGVVAMRSVLNHDSSHAFSVSIRYKPSVILYNGKPSSLKVTRKFFSITKVLDGISGITKNIIFSI